MRGREDRERPEDDFGLPEAYPVKTHLGKKEMKFNHEKIPKGAPSPTTVNVC